MHLVTITPKGVADMKASIPHITEGRFLICDGNCGELFVTKRAEKAEYCSRTIDGWWGLYINSPPSLLLLIHGGHGDQLFLTHEQYPDWKISVCVFDQYFAVWESPGLEFVQKAPYPLPAERMAHYTIVSFEEVIQPGMDAVTAMAERLRVEVTNNQPFYRISDTERAAAESRFPRTERKRIGVQLKASAKCRSWPARHVQMFVNACSLNGWEVFLFGAPGEAQGQMPSGVVNLTAADPALSFRESCAILPSCDVVVAPDSAIAHAAGALDVPTLALYGPFLASERVSHSPSIRPLQGHGGCPLAPCNFHQIAGQEFPDNGGCSSTGVCSEMDALKPSYLIQQVKKILRL